MKRSVVIAMMIGVSAAPQWAQTAVPPLAAGAGGPILLVGSQANLFSYYNAEILRNEGLTEFATADVSNVTAAALGGYDVVVLGAMSLTAAQAGMFTAWVNQGGRLIALRPDKQLAGLLGLIDAASTMSDTYLLINTSSGPGQGLVNATLGYHGPADLYTLNGATAAATLYLTDTAATSYPAVVWKSVGVNGGKAAAFTFDLARSVVYTHQGNPAWVGQARDGLSPLRSDDLFYGNASFDSKADWNSVRADKVAIPTADELQRLLANLILFLNSDRTPLPRNWYFPFGKKGVVLMTQDDHYNGAGGRFDLLNSYSQAGCNVDNWECMRGSSYIFPGTNAMTPAQAAAYTAQGFEAAVHVNNNCVNYTFSSLDSVYTTMFAAFAAQFPGLAGPVSQRMHCVVWSDYTTQADVEFNHGVRLDATYYYYPPNFAANPGYFTGSGLPMRFARLDGSMIDVYQAPTQIPDESLQSEPAAIQTMLSNATGPQGYFGVTTINAHDASDTLVTQVVSAAKQFGVPVVSGRQLLQWLDGRNTTTFGGFSWNGSTLRFNMSLGAHTNGLQAMLPAAASAGQISSLTLNSAPVSYTVQTMKGVNYAVFSGAAGAYVATYGTNVPVSVSVSPGSVALYPNQTQTFTASVAGTTNQAVSWSRNPAVGSISGGGVYTAPAVMSAAQTVMVTATSVFDATKSATAMALLTLPDTTTPTVAITSPAAGVTVSGGISVTASAADNVGVAGVQFKLDGANLGAEVTAAPYTVNWNTQAAANGTHTLTAVARDAAGNQATSAGITVTVTNIAPANSAVFLQADSTTRGSWKAVYGADGAAVANDAASYPAYAKVTFNSALLWTWDPSPSDVRAPQKVLLPGAIASTWYSSSGFSIDVNLTDGNPHTLAVYCLDWDSTVRVQSIQVTDAVSGAVLDSRSLANFNGGQYLVWKVSGHVVIQLTRTSGANAVVSGIFLAPSINVPVAVSVSPASVTLTPNQAQTFTASVAGTTNQTVSWSRNPAVGSISTGGVYTAPAVITAAQTVVVTATSVFDATKSATAMALLTVPDSTPPTVAITSPGAGVTVSGGISVTASASDNVGVAGVQFKLDGANLGAEVTAAPYTINWNTQAAANGTHTLTAVARDAAGNQATSAGRAVTVANTAPANSAVFLKLDTTTKGSWKGVYGADGAAVASDAASYPAYAKVSFNSALLWTWDPGPSDVRAPQKVLVPGAIASTWYSSGFSIDVNLTDGNPHTLAVYCVDWDSTVRVQSIQVTDAVSGAVLDSRSLANFNGGQYLVWKVSGHVVIQLTRTAGANAVVSGIFLAP